MTRIRIILSAALRTEMAGETARPYQRPVDSYSDRLPTVPKELSLEMAGEAKAGYESPLRFPQDSSAVTEITLGIAPIILYKRAFLANNSIY